MTERFKDSAVTAVAEALFLDRKQQLLNLQIDLGALPPAAHRPVLDLLTQPSPWCLSANGQALIKDSARKVLTDLDIIGLIHDSAKCG